MQSGADSSSTEAEPAPKRSAYIHTMAADDSVEAWLAGFLEEESLVKTLAASIEDEGASPSLLSISLPRDLL